MHYHVNHKRLYGFDGEQYTERFDLHTRVGSLLSYPPYVSMNRAQAEEVYESLGKALGKHTPFTGGGQTVGGHDVIREPVSPGPGEVR